MDFGGVAPLGEDIHLWTIALDRPAERCAQDAELLSDEEAVRAARFRFARDRGRFIVGRAALRRILGHYMGEAPEALRFSYGRWGKPGLDGPQAGPPLAFNLSHSRELALLAVAHDCALGADVEWVRNSDDLERLAQRFFAPPEVAELSGIGPSRYATAFFACWTRKEAFLKAFGAGLSVPLDGFCVSVDPDKPARLHSTAWRPGEAERWVLADVAIDTGIRAAIAIDRPIGQAQSWHLADRPEPGQARMAPLAGDGRDAISPPP